MTINKRNLCHTIILFAIILFTFPVVGQHTSPKQVTKLLGQGPRPRPAKR